MRDMTEANLTDAVLAKLAGATNPRFQQVMSSLLRHLHAFVREAELTEAEWLGVSMLVDALNHRKSTGATESTVLGPFYVPSALELPNGTDLAAGLPGEPTLFSGRVLAMDGKPLPGAQIDTW